LTIVSIMSSGAGSVGVSARPALPTTMSTSGKRQKTMSRSLRSSADSVTDARGTVMGMSMIMPSSSGVRNSLSSGRMVWSATRAMTTRLATAATRTGQRRAAHRLPQTARNSAARNTRRSPSGARPTTRVTPRNQTSGAGRDRQKFSTGR
jgi:hypothetical protein